ncbi:putative membrane protein [Paenibacillus wynnii]|nr:putative membrane protein [Paenibacillus wynnii]
MIQSSVRNRKMLIMIHMVSISLWMGASFFLLLGAVLNSETWVKNLHQFILNPSHIVAMASGIILIYFSRGKLFRKGWFLIKVVLLISSLLFMNIWISNFIKELNYNALIYSISIYTLILVSILYLSIKKPKRYLAKKRLRNFDSM